MATHISDAQWIEYFRTGILRLGKLLDGGELTELQRRIDDIMLGKARVNYDRMLMQLDGDTGRYEDAGAMSKGHKGATLGYRKIQELEFDPLFLRYMQRPIFREICAEVYGSHCSISCFRAMFMNKPSNKGTFLPWHQDWWQSLDHDPLVTVYTALDPATKDNGCVQLIPASHRLGVVNPSHGSGFLTKEQAARYCPPEKAVHLELEAGEVALLHNWVMHGSDVNRTTNPRRAFSVCYMDARTKSNSGEQFSVIFGDGALVPEQLETRTAAAAV